MAQNKAVTLFHHSPQLFSAFDMSRTGSTNGSGLWANTQPTPTMSNQDRVEYSFTLDDPQLMQISRPLPAEDFQKLYKAAIDHNDQELRTAMEASAEDQFTPTKFNASFANQHADTITKAGQRIRRQ